MVCCCCCCCCGAITIESQWPVGTRKSLQYPSFSYSMPDFERLVGVEGFVICTGQKITWTSGNQSHHIARPKAMYRIGLQYLQKDHLVAQTMYIGITSATSSSVFFFEGCAGMVQNSWNLACSPAKQEKTREAIL